MAHFAEIDGNNIVQRVIVVPDSEESNGASWCASMLGGTWLQTSYTGRIRKNYAGIGYTYDAQRDAFIAPQPFPSWVLNETTCVWEPPSPKPDGIGWYWDEDAGEWMLEVS
jgi:hypothetical protein